MTTYNTGNSIGSTSPKDLYDNAENLDVLLLDQEKLSHPDRLGVPRWTYHGMEERFAELMASSGFQFLADYAPTAGIEVTEYNQLLRDSTGNLWRLDPSVSLPYTTDGSGMPEGGAFLSAGDASALAALDQFKTDLDDPAQGGDLVGVTTSTGAQTLNEALDSRASKQEVTLTVNIPTDYPTLQEAIDDLSTLSVKRGAFIDLVIETGHSPDSGIVVENGSYGHFRVSSQDAEVVVGPLLTGYFVRSNLATAPVINTIIDGNGVMERGYSLSVSQGWINTGCGFKNCTGRPFYAQASTAYIAQSVWDGNGDGIYCTSGSGVQAGSIQVSNSTSPLGAIVVSRGSAFEAQGASITDCITAFHAKRAGSSINAHQCTITGCTGLALLVTRAAAISIDEGTVSECHGPLLENNGGTFSAQVAQMTAAAGNVDIGVRLRGGYVGANGATISGFGSNGVLSTQGGIVNLQTATVQNNGGAGVVASEGSMVSCNGATISGNTGGDLSIGGGSQISAIGCTTTNGAGSPDVTDTNLPGVGGFNFADNGNRGFIWA